MVKEGLSIRLQEARAACGLSPQDVAEKISVTVQAVSNWEKGRSFPDVGNLVKLSDLYGESLDWLLKGEKIEVATEKRKKRSKLWLKVWRKIKTLRFRKRQRMERSRRY